MTARTIIAKLVAFLFVQILSFRIRNLHNVQVLLLSTGWEKNYTSMLFLVLSLGFLNPRL